MENGRQAPVIPGFVAKCKKPKNIPMRDFVCIATSFIRAMVADDLARLAAFALVLSFLPLLLWQFEQGLKAKTSRVFSRIVIVLVALVGQMAGIGVVAAVIIAPSYAISKMLEPKDHRPSPHHNNPAYTVVSSVLHIAVLLIAVAVVVVPQTSPHLDLLSYTFQVRDDRSLENRQLMIDLQAYPFFFLPLLLFRPKSPSASQPFAAKDANVFDLVSLLTTPLWWLSVAASAYAWFVRGVRLTNPIAHLFLWDLLGVVAALWAVYLVDVAAGEASGLPNVLLNSLFVGPPCAFSMYVGDKERVMAGATLKKKEKKQKKKTK